VALLDVLMALPDGERHARPLLRALEPPGAYIVGSHLVQQHPQLVALLPFQPHGPAPTPGDIAAQQCVHDHFGAVPPASRVAENARQRLPLEPDEQLLAVQPIDDRLGLVAFTDRAVLNVDFAAARRLPYAILPWTKRWKVSTSTLRLTVPDGSGVKVHEWALSQTHRTGDLTAHDLDLVLAEIVKAMAIVSAMPLDEPRPSA
jgi:hypothetical protein